MHFYVSHSYMYCNQLVETHNRSENEWCNSVNRDIILFHSLIFMVIFCHVFTEHFHYSQIMYQNSSSNSIRCDVCWKSLNSIIFQYLRKALGLNSFPPIYFPKKIKEQLVTTLEIDLSSIFFQGGTTRNWSLKTWPEYISSHEST